MKIQFSILWYDDDEEYFASIDLTNLNSQITDWGFEPNIEKITDKEGFISKAPYTQYDLIVVDKNLGGEQGDKLIQDLRGYKLYTEVIFYSAAGTDELWKLIQEQKLEGVFVSHRDLLIEKIIIVGRQSINKVLDLENLRGIVMAEIGEIDLLFEDIISSGFSALKSEKQERVFRQCLKKQKQNVDTTNRKIEANSVCTLDSLLQYCNSTESRWENFQRIRKELSIDEIGDFVNDVMKPRNMLAHGKPRIIENENAYEFQFNDEVYKFDEMAGVQLRKKIIQYKNTLEDIKHSLPAHPV